jgi:hypothetical protein
MRFRICLLIFGLAMMISGSLVAQSPRISRSPASVPPDDRPLCLPNPCLPGDTTSRIFRIGLVADPQYCDAAPFNGRQFRLAPDKLATAIDTFNRWQIDLLINLGDIIDRGPESFQAMRTLYDSLQAPYLHVLGNHEFHQIPAGLKPTIMDSLGMGAAFCDFGVKGWRMILLDGTELAGYAREAHPDLAEEGESLWQSVQGKSRGKSWNGGIGQAQREWLRSRLDFAAYHNEQVIIFCHFPIMPADHHSNLWNDLQMRNLIRPYPNVVAWIAGHYHDGNYRYWQDVHHLTLRGMVMTADSNAFSVLDIYPDRLEMNGFGREPYRRLPLRETYGCEAIEGVSNTETKVDATADTAPLLRVPRCVERTFLDVNGKLVQRDEVPDSAKGLQRAPESLPEGMYWLRFPDADGWPGVFAPILPKVDW